MPKVNGARWKDCRLDLDLNSDNAAARLGISGGHLRNIEGSYVVASERLIRRAASLYGVQRTELVDGGNNDGVPDEPPEQPKNPTKKTGRDKDPKGPPRTDRAESRLAS